MNKKLYEEIFKSNPYFIWWVEDLTKVSDEAAVEAILNNGDWNDVQKLIDILGIKKVSEIFHKQISNSRNNYRPLTKNFFKLYFKQHAS
jgi:hypothetical protein